MTDCIQRKLHNLSLLIKNKTTLTLFNKKVFIKILMYISNLNITKGIYIYRNRVTYNFCPEDLNTG